MTALTDAQMRAIAEGLRRTKTERLMRPAFGGIMLDMEEERESPVNPDGPKAANAILALLDRLAKAEAALEDAVTQAFIEGAEWQKQGRPGRFGDVTKALRAALATPDVGEA